MSSNLREKWNELDPQKRRYILFGGLVGTAMFLAFAIKPNANQEVEQDQKEAQVETTVMTPEKPVPDLEKLLSSSESMRKAFEDSQKTNQALLDENAKLKDQKDQAAQESTQQQQSELTTQVASLQQELKLLKMSKDGGDTVQLPPLPELSGNAVPALPGSPNDPTGTAAELASPPAPRLVYVRKSGDQQPSSPASAEAAPARVAQLSPAMNAQSYILTAGSILEGILLSGMDAPTSAAAKKTPYPALIRIKKEAILPNYYRQNVRECFVVVSGFGELSSERANLRTERLSCVRTDGAVIESEISGYVTGEDGKVGLRGRLVTKQGALIAKSLAAGTLAGFGEAVQPQAIPQLSLSSDSTQSFQRPDLKMAAESGVYRGISEAAGAVSQFYLEMAKEMVPVIEVDAGRKVNIILVKGVNLSLSTVGSKEQSE